MKVGVQTCSQNVLLFRECVMWAGISLNVCYAQWFSVWMLFFYSLFFSVTCCLGLVSMFCSWLKANQPVEQSGHLIKGLASKSKPSKIKGLLNIVGSWPNVFHFPSDIFMTCSCLKTHHSSLQRYYQWNMGEYSLHLDLNTPSFLFLQHKPSQENNKQMSGMGTASSDST